MVSSFSLLHFICFSLYQLVFITIIPMMMMIMILVEDDGDDEIHHHHHHHQLVEDGQKWKLDFLAENLQLLPHFALVPHLDILCFVVMIMIVMVMIMMMMVIMTMIWVMAMMMILYKTFHISFI